MIKHFVDKEGNFIGTFVAVKRRVFVEDEKTGEKREVDPIIIWPKFPQDAVEVAECPEDVRDKYEKATKKWIKYVPTREEKLQVNLGDTEQVNRIARAIEEIILRDTQGQPISENAKKWALERKRLREEIQ